MLICTELYVVRGEQLLIRLALGDMNPDDIDEMAWQQRENECTLYAPMAGEMLYRVKV